MYGDNFKELIGEVVKELHIADDALTFTLENGSKYQYAVEGDCCSHSYYHAVTGADKIIGKKLVSVEEIDLEEAEKNPNENDSDCVQVYGFRFSADPGVVKLKGTDAEVEVSNSMIVEFRNSSNGYYGGYVTAASKVENAMGEKVEKDWVANSKE